MTNRKLRAFVFLAATLFLISCSTSHQMDEGGIGGSGHAEEASQQ